MTIRRVETWEKWLILKQALIEKSYKLWQMQYSWNQSEGFIAGFYKQDKNVEVITHIKEIQEDIVNNL